MSPAAPASILALFLSLTAEEAKVSVVRPGGGIVVADGLAQVPLVLVLEKKGTIKSARITAAAGKISGVRVLDGRHVAFLYAVPRRAEEEELEVTLQMDDGERSETFPFRVPTPAGPALELALEPSVLTAGKPWGTVEASASASGSDVEGLELAATPGAKSDAKTERLESAMRAVQAIDASHLPVDEPSYVLALAAAATAKGWSARAGGVATEAPLRVSLEIPPRSVLSIEGASNKPASVVAPADGRTVIEKVVVRYGARVRAFAKKGSKKTEVSLALPSAAPAGLAVAIPGQAYADGGTGPTIALAAPPSPFGGEPLWPAIAVEGAELVQAIKVAPDVRVLVLKRPSEPRTISVLLDEQKVGAVELRPRRGQVITLAETTIRSGERAALELSVRDLAGQLTDEPTPTARLASGEALVVSRVSLGRYRAIVPTTVLGPQGIEVRVVAELPALPFVAGDQPSPVAVEASAILRGPAGPVRGEEDERGEVARTERAGRRVRIGASVTGGAGTTFGSMTTFGGAVLAEVRLPLLDGRLAARAGLGYLRAGGDGKVAFDLGGASRELGATTTIGAFVVPIDLGYAIVATEDLELLVRAGGELRLASGALELDGMTATGGKATMVAGRASLEGAVRAGPGWLVLSGGLSGIGADASGFSSTGASSARRVTLEGALMTAGGEAGYRIWF